MNGVPPTSIYKPLPENSAKKAEQQSGCMKERNVTVKTETVRANGSTGQLSQDLALDLKSPDVSAVKTELVAHEKLSKGLDGGFSDQHISPMNPALGIPLGYVLPSNPAVGKFGKTISTSPPQDPPETTPPDVGALDLDEINVTIPPNTGKEQEIESQSKLSPDVKKEQDSPPTTNLDALIFQNLKATEASIKERQALETQEQKVETQEQKVETQEQKVETQEQKVAKEMKVEEIRKNAQEALRLIKGLQDLIKSEAKLKGISDERAEFICKKASLLFEELGSSGDLGKLYEMFCQLEKELSPEEFDILRSCVERKLGECNISFHFQPLVASRKEIKGAEMGKTPMHVARYAQESPEPKRGEKAQSKKPIQEKAPQIERKTENEKTKVARKVKIAQQKEIIEKVQLTNLKNKEIVSGEIKESLIKTEQIKSEDFKTQLTQQGINKSRLEPVIKEFIAFVKYLNSAKNIDGLEERFAQLKNALSDEELVIVLQLVVQKLEGK